MRCDGMLTWRDFFVMTAGIMKIVNALVNKNKLKILKEIFKYNIFWEESKLVNKTTLSYSGYRERRIAEDKKKSRREKRQERKILLEDENDGE